MDNPHPRFGCGRPGSVSNPAVLAIATVLDDSKPGLSPKRLEGYRVSGQSLILSTFCLFAVCVELALMSPLNVSGQEFGRAMEPMGVIGKVKTVSVAGPEEDSDDATSATGIEAIKKANSEKYAGGAPLKTNPEMEELMKRAELFAGENSFRNATLLWQRVLERSGDSLYTSDGETYYSLAREVERRIAKLPEEGMRVYRVSADGESRAIMAQASSPADQGALAKIVENYFLSSTGDEAAFQLGCLALDQHDFVGASRLFQKIIDEYPSPTVPLDQIYLRLALANANIGDEKSARAAIENARQLAAEDSQQLIELISENIESYADSASDRNNAVREYRMRLANANRIGVMPSPPKDVLETDLTIEWKLILGAKETKDRSKLTWENVAAASPRIDQDEADGSEEADSKHEKDSGQQVRGASDSEGKKLVDRWNDRGWMAAGQILVGKDQIYFKTLNDVTSWPTDAPGTSPAWRSLWLNKYVRDDLTAAYELYRRNRNNNKTKSKLPESVEEVFFFGDRIHQSMLLHENVLYAVEGERYSRFTSPPRNTQHQNFNVYGNSIPRRTRTSYLTAYHAETGKLLWHRSAAEPVKPDGNTARTTENADKGTGQSTVQDQNDDSRDTNAEDTAFMAAPVSYGNMLICPISEGGAIYLCGMDRNNNGKTIWRSYLCDEPANGAAPWSPIEISVEGRDVYAVCGTGAVFALDAVSGAIRFARRYVRDERNSTIRTNYNNVASKAPEGWDDDLTIPYENALVVMASDHNRMFAIDRRTGDLIWQAPRSWMADEYAATYCLGVYNEKLYCAGSRVVICYDIGGEGRLSWVKELEPQGKSFGRGFVCAAGVYIPSGKSIVRFDLKSGDQTGKANVALDGEEMVGNLFCDGKRIWTIGANRVYALASVRSRIKVLDKRVEEGDTQALLQRMQLNSKTGKVDLALADLDALVKLAVSELETDDNSQLFKQIVSAVQISGLSNKEPAAFIATLHNGYQTASPTTRDELISDLGNKRSFLLQLLQDIPKSETAVRIQSIVRLSDLVPEVNDRFVLGRELARSAQPEDLLRLLEEAKSNPQLYVTTLGPTVRMAVGKLEEAGEDVGSPAYQQQMEPLQSLLHELVSSDLEDVRFVAAYEMLNLGDVAGLETMIDLLEVENATLRSLAANMLTRSTGHGVPFSAVSDRSKRGPAIEEWREWLKEDGADVELVFPIEGDILMRNRTLICDSSRQRLLEYATTDLSQAVWERKLPAVHAAQSMPDGSRVVLSFQGKRVVVLDEHDREQVVYKTDVGNPTSVKVLENGNFLISVSRSNRHAAVEVDRSGETVWEYKPEGKIAAMDAQRLDNGNTLIAAHSMNAVIEVSPSGETVWEKKNLGSPYSAQRLENGNTLIAEFSGGRVSEYDRSGDSVWEKTGLVKPQVALRRADGHTMIGHSRGLLEVDKDGNDINQLKLGRVTSIQCY